MLLRFNYDTKKAGKAYRHRCWTEYWYLSVLLVISVATLIYSYLNLEEGLIYISVFSSIIIACIRNKLASNNCKMNQNIDITDQHLIIRWVHHEDTFGYDSEFDYLLEKSRKTKKKTVIPLDSIDNLKIDKKSKRITFDYRIHKSKACRNKNDKRDIGHMVMYDVYDKNLADELLIQIHKTEKIS